jgi:xylulokinase
MMTYILAHDVGTSGNKATLFDEKGAMVASEVASYPVRFFNGTWAEQNADDWWQAMCTSTRALLSRLDLNPADIAAVSFSGQMMGCLPVDAQGNPLRPSIIWADQRAQQQAAQLAQHLPMRAHFAITGHRNTASYGLPKLMWLKDNEPDIYRNAHKVLNAKDYIVYKLTGEFVTEPTDAAGFNAVDLRTYSWSQEVLDASGIARDKLPDIAPSTAVVGRVHAQAARETGLMEGTPVVPGGGDGLCANVGVGSVAPGHAYCSLGSSAWVAATCDQPLVDDQMRVVTWVHIVPGLYSPNAAMQAAGNAHAWVKNTLCGVDVQQAGQMGVSPYALLNKRVEKSPPGAHGVLFLPHLLGERSPRWNPDARGAYIGMGMETTLDDLVRAALEGITMNLKLNLDIIADMIPLDNVLATGGGARGDVWCQIMADVFGLPVQVPELLEEATSMGAAVTGGVGVGLYKDFGITCDMVAIARTHMPDAEAVYTYRQLLPLFDQAYHALEPMFTGLVQHAAGRTDE